jgi:dipeptidase D
VAEVCGDVAQISAMVRGADVFHAHQAEAQISALAKMTDAKVHFIQRTPAWPYNPESDLLKAALQTYKSLFSREAEIIAIHAGLECGLFSQKFAESGAHLDIISLGPNAYDYHTPDERVSISSTGRVWEFLQKLLAGL